MSIKKVFNIYENLPEFLDWISGEDIKSENTEESIVLGPVNSENKTQITLEKVEHLHSYLSNGGECILNTNIRGHEDFLSHALKRYLGIEKNSMNLDELSNGDLKEQYSLKLCDHLSLGEYSDVISTDAYSQKHNFVKVRNYIMKCLSYFSYLNKGDICFIPLDIDYGFSDNKFFIQVHANVQNFVKEYLLSSFLETNRDHPYQSLLKDAYLETDYMEIAHLEGAEKIIISAVWFKEVGFEDFFPSLILKDVKRYAERENELSTRLKIKIVKTTINIPSTELPGKSVDLIGGISEEKEELTKIQHIVEVLQRFRVSQEEDSRIPIAILSASDLDNYDDQMEKQYVKNLSEDQKEYVLECLKNPNELDHVEKGIDQILNPFDTGAYVDNFSENLENLSADELNKYILSEIDGEEDVLEAFTDEKWNDKKNDIVKKIRSKKSEKDLAGSGRVEMNSSFLNIISTGLNAKPQRGKPLVDDLGNKSVEKLIENKIEAGEMTSSGFDLELSRQAQKYENMLKTARDTNVKSKKIIDMMKGQISSMADAENKIQAVKAAATARGEELDDRLQLDALKLELKNALSDVRNRESTIEKIRQSTDHLIKIKDTEITQLKKKIIPTSKDEKVPFKKSQLAAAEEIIGDDDPIEVILKAKEENKNLTSQIDILQKRLSHLNDNMEKGSNEKLNRAESQIKKLRETSSAQAQSLQAMREEKDNYLRLYKVKEKDFSRLQEDFRLVKIEMNKNIAANEVESKKEKVTQTENVEVLAGNDQATNDKLKVYKTKMKAYDQKIKFLNAQLDAANKKANNNSGGAMSSSRNDGASNLKVKQLETLKIKAEEGLSKSLKDLSAAKKEAHMLKQELSLAKNQIIELERKTGKKVA